MSRPLTSTSSNASPQTSTTSPGTLLSATSAGSSTWRGSQSEVSSPYLSQTPVIREYVSPYPPLPSTSASPAALPNPAISSIQPRASRSVSATRNAIATQESAENVREYASSASLPERSRYQSFRPMSDVQPFTPAQKQAYIKALNERRVNTIGELRRIERVFATLGSEDLTQPMTSAWVHYVNSNSLLTELRGLTRNYPFSSECVEEGKRRVHQDPSSNRSWNYCWLVLAKIHTDKLIPTYARAQASRPEMWAGRSPQAESVNQLTEAFEQEWSAALAQLLRYWEAAPIR